MALSVVCNGNQWKDYLEFIAEFGSNEVFSLKCQRDFILITTGIRVLYLLFRFVVYISLSRCDAVFWWSLYSVNINYLHLSTLCHTAWLCVRCDDGLNFAKVRRMYLSVNRIHCIIIIHFTCIMFAKFCTFHFRAISAVPRNS
jgi:hypothetical protein